MPAINDKHHLLRTFCSVVHFGSFSKAAVFLRMPTSSVSKNVKQLEQHLKTQLIVRNTRSMNLTDAGMLYYEKGRKILKSLDDLEQELHSLSRTTEGKLRVSLPMMIGEYLMSPLISEFSLQNPDIQFELDYSHQPVDLLEQDFDVAFRTSSTLPDSSLFEIKLMQLQPVYVASQEYLDKRGKPSSLADLIKHDKLVFNTNISVGNQKATTGTASERTDKIVSNSYQSLVTAAISGCGIACVYDVFVIKELAENQLIQVLKQQQPQKKYLSILYRQKGSTSGKIRSFIEFIKHHPRLKQGKFS